MGIVASITAVCDRCHKEQFAVDLEGDLDHQYIGEVAEAQAPVGWSIDDGRVCCPRCRVLCSLCECPVGGDYRNVTFDIATRYGSKTCVLCGPCRAKIPHPPSR